MSVEQLSIANVICIAGEIQDLPFEEALLQFFPAFRKLGGCSSDDLRDPKASCTCGQALHNRLDSQ